MLIALREASCSLQAASCLRLFIGSSPSSSGSFFNLSASRSVHTSTCLWKKQAGRYKVTLKQDRPLTYEQAQPPYQIAHTKNWNSFNTSNVLDGLRRSESATEDFFIRRFIAGTWHKLFLSDVVIKRRGNIIILSGIVAQSIHPRKMYFLLGYTEEILSYMLKCPFKMELQTLADRRDMIFKKI